MKQEALMVKALWGRGLLGAFVVALVAALLVPASVMAAEPAPTFAKDVAPIFQQKCQVCHRPDSIGPMSLVTYADVRPWARSIRQRVASRDMPPWHLDNTVGIQKFKNDRSLTTAQIDTITRWVDAGAPLGDPKDLPPPVQWPNEDIWTNGPPDFTVTLPFDHVMYPNGPDWFADYEVETGLTEDRYIKAVETKPAKTKKGRSVVHHAITYALQGADASDVDRLGFPLAPGSNQGVFINEYAVGKGGETFPENTGKLLKAGGKIRFNMHYFAVGEEVRDRPTVGFRFYPRGVVPKYVVIDPDQWAGSNELDIPANTLTRHDGYWRLPRPAKLLTYQPHMHMRGKAMTLEAIDLNGKATVINRVDRFNFNWHTVYEYDDDVAPLLPAGTVLHIIGIHDNTAANRNNPDPNAWIGYGSRSIDDMLLCHINMVYLNEEEYERQVAERKAKEKRQTDSQQQ
jgi:hypothetical protein